MKSMENSPQRQAIINKMMDIARHDAPWNWGFFPKQFSLHHIWVLNSKPNLMANNTLKYQRLEPALRAELQNKWNRPVRWPLYAMAIVIVLIVIPAFAGFRRQQRMSAYRETR